MVTIKVFDSRGIKTLKLSGYANDQPYDEDDSGFDEPEVEEVENDYDNPF